MSAPYGAWPSPVDAELVASGSRGYAELRGQGDALFWLESRPDEGGRTTLVHWHAGVSRELTPVPFNPRSRVHEYGGGAFCVADDRAYFVNFADQNVYGVRYETEADVPYQVTQGDATERFADIVWDGTAILAVRERHDGDSEPVNDLVRIDVGSGGVQCLHSGHDFYAAPRPSGDGRLAFVAWDHPNMPFDGTQLFLVRTDDGADSSDTTLIAGGARESVVQPEWCAGRLVFATDAGGYWNLHVHDDSGVFTVLQEDAEYAGPAWVFGSSYYVPVGPRHVVARRIENGLPSLVLVDLDQGLASPSRRWLLVVRGSDPNTERRGLHRRIPRPAQPHRGARTGHLEAHRHRQPAEAEGFRRRRIRSRTSGVQLDAGRRTCLPLPAEISRRRCPPTTSRRPSWSPLTAARHRAPRQTFRGVCSTTRQGAGPWRM